MDYTAIMLIIETFRQLANMHSVSVYYFCFATIKRDCKRKD